MGHMNWQLQLTKDVSTDAECQKLATIDFVNTTTFPR